MKPQNMNIHFDDLALAPKMLELLTRHKLTVPTPIQHQSIPPALEGKDIMGIAQTGTGKTFAFGLPMIQRIIQSGHKNMGLIIVPTRELALQVHDSLRKISSPLGLRMAVLIGGENIQKQLRALQLQPHIIIATPGRLIDHLEHTRLSLQHVRILVLDEADRMLDMGFAPQIKKVLERVPKDRQTMLFSATMPDEVLKIAHSTMSLPLRIEVAPAGTAIELVTQELFFVRKDEKLTLLKTILTKYQGSILLFSRTKHGATKLARAIRDMGTQATEIHSNRSLHQRAMALEGFKIGRYRVLVATDIAARGIDVKGIQLVINYDLPDSADDYVHRIGRTGRAGVPGHAISFATPDQRKAIHNIERLIRKPFPISKTPQFTQEERVTPLTPDRFDQRYPPRNNTRRPFSRQQQQRKKFNGNRNSFRKKFR